MKFNWNIITVLSIFALIRPLMSIMGVTEVIGQPYTSLTMTAVISIVWMSVIVYKRIETPVRHLIMTGVFYALFAIVLSGILSPILLEELQGPLINPFALVSMFMTNIIWGSLTGIIAWGIMKLINSDG